MRLTQTQLNQTCVESNLSFGRVTQTVDEFVFSDCVACQFWILWTYIKCHSMKNAFWGLLISQQLNSSCKLSTMMPNKLMWHEKRNLMTARIDLRTSQWKVACWPLDHHFKPISDDKVKFSNTNKKRDKIFLRQRLRFICFK